MQTKTTASFGIVVLIAGEASFAAVVSLKTCCGVSVNCKMELYG
jgi:hypothetical protein